MPSLSREEFCTLAQAAAGILPPGRIAAIPVSLRVLSDQLTPVLAYRRLVAPDERTAPSFLLESVEGGERQGRFSMLGSHPSLRVIARERSVEILDHRNETTRIEQRDDPLAVLREIGSQFHLLRPAAGVALPRAVLGGWFGYAGYDSVRYVESGKLPFAAAPPDDRGLPDLEFGFYDGITLFDHAEKMVHLVQLAMVGPGDDADAAYRRALDALERRAELIQRHSKPLPLGRIERETSPRPLASNLTREQHAAMVARAQEYIRAGDVFQVVLGQRFESESPADPFDVYRALRAVNPSPYMVYLQNSACILVASSPEILCRVRAAGQTPGEEAGRMVVTSRPLAGTRRRGATEEEDAALAAELRADAKERAEHAMLVDLGRNDVGRVARRGTVELQDVMSVERYSHVMHLSSTVTGELREGLDAWDALRATLPVGTISGAPKIRAMQIIDELEPLRRGPYGGGMGYVGLDGEMDLALALRTIVVPIDRRRPPGADGARWVYHVQAAGGIVADSRARDEYQETVNKAAALARAIDLAERAFGAPTDG